MEKILFAIGAMVFLAHFFSALFARTKIPDVLFLIVIGLLLGPVLHLVKPEDLGKVGSVMSTIALVFLLFDGGLALNHDDIAKSLKPTLTLTLVCFFATIVVTAGISHYMLSFPILDSLVLGAILGGTSSAVVIPLVRGLSMKDKTSTILILESAITDVLCIVFVFSLAEASRYGGELEVGKLGGKIISSFFMAAVIGLIGGILWLTLLQFVRQFPNTMFTTIAFVFILYGISEFLGFSGGISSLAFGFTLSNFRQLRLHELPFIREKSLGALGKTEKSFYNEAIFLLKTFFFVYLGLSIQFYALWEAGIAVVIVISIYIARILITKYTVSNDTPWKDAALTSAMAPKGLAAAVLAAIPLQYGMPHGETIQHLSYLVVLFSISLTAVLVVLIERQHVNFLYSRIFNSFQKNSEKA